MFLEHYKLYWKNFANFNGRTPRAGYWFFVLWNIVIGAIIFLITFGVSAGSITSLVNKAEYFTNDPLSTFSGIFGVLGGMLVISIIIGAWNIANIIPGLSIVVRRLHDTGRRWFWMFLWIGPVVASIILVILAVNDFWHSLQFLIAAGICGLAALAGAIVILIFMCLPTSARAMGVSTHGMYPQWQDNYGSGVNYGGVGYGGGEGNAQIIGVTGMYRGAVFPLDNDEELIIGRDAMLSHIVITENAEKISRKHINISFDSYENVYMVTDLSSNGTYLEDGTRLIANIPVKLGRGTVIYLAKKENTFRLG